MVEKDDWRLTVNNGKSLRKACINPTDGEEICKHAPQLKKCAFCLEPVQNDPHQWWFIPIDFSCCICENCFNDFKKMFEWKKLDGWDIDGGDEPEFGQRFNRLAEKYGDDFSWLKFPVDGAQKSAFEERLQAEITSKHPLYGLSKKFTAVAKSERNDDVLYFDGVSYYIVHLTWSSGNAIYPRFNVVSEGDIIEYLEKDYLFG